LRKAAQSWKNIILLLNNIHGHPYRLHTTTGAPITALSLHGNRGLKNLKVTCWSYSSASIVGVAAIYGSGYSSLARLPTLIRMNKTVLHVLRNQSPLASTFWMVILLALAGCENPATTLEYKKIVCEEWHKSLQTRSSISFTCRQLFQDYSSIKRRKGFPREKDADSEGYTISYTKIRAEIVDYCRNI
tara:strand:- start:99 stop:662 length:564 start_codon:yes stop_codon:yes gene_type:complete